jgi:hypothetical protein
MYNIYTLKISDIYCFSTATAVARMYLNITLYVHWLLCLLKPRKGKGKGNPVTGPGGPIG